MTLAEKLQTIAENEQKVFDAGCKSQYDEFWDNFQQNGAREDYYYVFSGYGWIPETFKPKYDIKGTRFQGTFMGSAYCVVGSFTERLKELNITLDTSKATMVSSMFAYCSKVTELPTLDLSNATSNSGVFSGCVALRKVEKIIFGENNSKYNTFFENCNALEEIEFAGVISNIISLQWSTKLNHDSITSLINCLSTTTNALTVTLSATAVNNAFETSEGAANGSNATEWLELIATKPNWTISLV